MLDDRAIYSGNSDEHELQESGEDEWVLYSTRPPDLGPLGRMLRFGLGSQHQLQLSEATNDIDDDRDDVESIEFKRLPLPSAPVSSAQQTQTPPQNFHYSRLDYQMSSIRLLRLHPDKSIEGLIQCDLRNALIEDKYSCLSYVWGDEAPGEWIILDGQKFWVRRNLFDFLRYARRKPQLRAKWLWIDALCIDQTTMAERNHQVQQMGQIYMGAKEVISWLGCNDDIAEFLQKASMQEHFSKGFGSFCHSQYWDRAWITQEIVLARRVKFMANKSTLDGTLVPLTDKQICELRISNLHPQTVHNLRGRSLIYLLDKFRQKKSGNLRDRVFSLLALCGDGSSLKVDYDTTLPTLAQSVLRTCKQSFCLCSVGIVGNALGLPLSMDEGNNSDLAAIPFAQIKIPDQPLIPDQELYYTRPCRQPRCDGTDHSHIFNVNEPTAKQTIFAVTVDIRYLCNTYRGLVTFFVNADLSVIAFRYNSYYMDRMFDSHHVSTDFGQEQCTIRISFTLLLRIARLNQFADRCCTRIASLGTATQEDSSVLLDFGVLDAGAEDC